MPEGFYPFVNEEKEAREEAVVTPSVDEVHYEARVAVYDDPTITPRVVVIEPKAVRDYLEEITRVTNQLSHEQGGTIPFMIPAEEVDEMGVLDPPERVCRRSLGVGRRLLGLCRTTGGHIEDKTGIHQASLRVIVGIVFNGTL